MQPINTMNGYDIPVSAFVDHADGQFELGISAYEKRGVAVTVPRWDSEICIQCNNCAYVCPHATIRAFALDADEAAKAPANTQLLEANGKAAKEAGLKYTLAISPLDCMGCSVCVEACPRDALTMMPIKDEMPQQEVFDYCVANITEKPELAGTTNVKASQFKQPLLEFSGACAGCAETQYARLLTQVVGDRLFISNATGCSSIWGNPGGIAPYTVNKDGHGPAWNNSLFEDNAEHGLGMYLGYMAEQNRAAVKAEGLVDDPGTGDATKLAAREWLDAREDAEASKKAAAALVAALEADGSDAAKSLLEDRNFLTKKSFWILGGDGWAYDIGYGGLDHVIASKENVNIFVFDTEVYSNTGGQSSKASRLGQVAQFAAAGKDIKKKSLSEIAMTYGYVYVAQVAIGANPAQTLKAINEAEAYDGPSLIIGYSPCEMHSIKGGMANCGVEMKRAVDCGYWNLFRYNPAAEPGKKFTLDSKEPAGGYQEFLMNEARYSRLTREFPERAQELFEKNEAAAYANYQHLVKLKEMYDGE